MIAILFEWRMVEPDQWRRLIAELDWQDKVQNGTAMFEAGRSTGRAVVIDVWQTLEALEYFLSSVLARRLVSIGLPQPLMKAWSLSGSDRDAASVNNLALRKSLELSMVHAVRN